MWKLSNCLILQFFSIVSAAEKRMLLLWRNRNWIYSIFKDINGYHPLVIIDNTTLYIFTAWTQNKGEIKLMKKKIFPFFLIFRVRVEYLPFKKRIFINSHYQGEGKYCLLETNLIENVNIFSKTGEWETRHKPLLIFFGTNKKLLRPEIMKLRVKKRDKNSL